MDLDTEDIDLDALEQKITNGDYQEIPHKIILRLIAELRELKKGKKMSTNLPKSLGMYEFERSTTRFHVYARLNEQGIKESQYVNKNHFDGEKPPAKLEFFIKY